MAALFDSLKSNKPLADVQDLFTYFVNLSFNKVLKDWESQVRNTHNTPHHKHTFTPTHSATPCTTRHDHTTTLVHHTSFGHHTHIRRPPPRVQVLVPSLLDNWSVVSNKLEVVPLYVKLLQACANMHKESQEKIAVMVVQMIKVRNLHTTLCIIVLIHSNDLYSSFLHSSSFFSPYPFYLFFSAHLCSFLAPAPVFPCPRTLPRTSPVRSLPNSRLSLTFWKVCMLHTYTHAHTTNIHTYTCIL